MNYATLASVKLFVTQPAEMVCMWWCLYLEREYDGKRNQVYRAKNWIFR